MTGLALASIGAGVIALGASIGIGVMWASGLSSMARQPEIASKLQVNMIIGAAFIEGIALFALVLCFLQM